MGSYGFDVDLSLKDTLEKLNKGIISGNITECINTHQLDSGNCGKAVVVVYGKHYYRVGNLLTLTVCVNNFNERTHVHVVGVGNSERQSEVSENSVTENFINSPRDILRSYILKN